ncbi:MAG: serine/threonine-protein kinase [Nannocystaceae bacterium]
MNSDDDTLVDAPGPARAPLGAGDAIGRYRIIERLGRGSMGVVYRAFDPTLERDVAVKLVSTGAPGTQARRDRDRLRIEARTLARVSHPNVVSVLDVGEHAGEVFFAMELVHGPTLRQWLHRRDRPWRDVFEVLLAVGRGLAAVHEVGLVHRDVKPSNVMMGDDGRPQLMDFGLASSTTEEQSTRGSSPSSAAGSARAGSPSRPQGTLLYMAPEQHQGRVLDPRADQFSLCVTMHEALLGIHPYEGGSPLGIAASIMEGRLRPLTATGRAPMRILATLRRGLATAPTDRYPDVPSLLQALERSARRPRVWALAAGLGSVAALSAALAVGPGPQRPPSDCAVLESSVASVWGRSTRAQVRERFAAAGESFAEESWPRVDQAMTEYQRAWTEHREAACSPSSAPPLPEGGLECLERQRRSFASLAEQLTHADPTTVRAAVTAVGHLPAVSDCTHPGRLQRRAILPINLAQRAKVQQLEGELAEVLSMVLLQRHDAVLTAVAELEPRARQLQQTRLLSDLLHMRGMAQQSVGRLDAAKAAASEAYFLSESEDDARGAATAALLLANVVGYHGRQTDEGLVWLRRADVAMQRMPEQDPAMAAMQHRITGNLAIVEGDRELALQQHRRAAELALAHWGRESLRPLVHREAYANALFHAGRRAEATEILRGVLADRERGLGPRSHRLASTLNNLAAMLATGGELDEAAGLLGRVVSLTEHGLPAEQMAAIDALRSLSFIRVEQDRLDEALELAQRRLELQQRLTPGIHAQLADAIASVGVVHSFRGEEEMAAQDFRRQLDMLRALDLEGDERYAMALFNWRQTALAVRPAGKVAERLEHEVGWLTRELGPDHPSTIRAEIDLATAQVAVDPAAGLERLEAIERRPFDALMVRAAVLQEIVNAVVDHQLDRARATVALAKLETLQGAVGEDERALRLRKTQARERLASGEPVAR